MDKTGDTEAETYSSFPYPPFLVSMKIATLYLPLALLLQPDKGQHYYSESLSEIAHSPRAKC